MRFKPSEMLIARGAEGIEEKNKRKKKGNKLQEPKLGTEIGVCAVAHARETHFGQVDWYTTEESPSPSPNPNSAEPYLLSLDPGPSNYAV